MSSIFVVEQCDQDCHFSEELHWVDWGRFQGFKMAYSCLCQYPLQSLTDIYVGSPLKINFQQIKKTSEFLDVFKELWKITLSFYESMDLWQRASALWAHEWIPNHRSCPCTTKGTPLETNNLDLSLSVKEGNIQNV